MLFKLSLPITRTALPGCLATRQEGSIGLEGAAGSQEKGLGGPCGLLLRKGPGQELLGMLEKNCQSLIGEELTDNSVFLKRDLRAGVGDAYPQSQHSRRLRQKFQV